LHLQVPPALFHRRFRLLWLGLMISVAGSQMQIWALFWHIRDLTDQPIALGMVGLARILPVVVFSLVAGALADTINRRKLMFITQTAQALVAVLLGVLTIRGSISLGMIYLLTAIQAVAVAFDLPARQALVPNLVPAKDLPNAFSLNSIAQQVGSIVGPALSGLVIALMGQSAVYLINAITFLAVLIALVMMGPVAQQAPAGAKPALNLKGIQEGIHFIINQPIILSTMIMDFFATFFSSANTLMPLYARDVLHVGVIQYGWLSAAQSIGAVGAALVISQVSFIRRQGPLFLLSVAAFGISTILFGLSKSFLMAMAALILVGASDSVSTIIRNTIRQLQTPDYIRGRMTSINQIFFMGGPQLGEVEAGLVAQLFNTPMAIVSGGIGCLVALALIIRRWPQLRTYNGEEASQPVAAS
jgi:MFS family permease